MKQLFLLLLVTPVLAVLYCAGFSVIPLPFCLISLPLILVSALALELRFGLAVTVAAISGGIVDLLSPTPFGIYLLASTLSAVLTAILLSRILTHHTLGATIGVNVTIFLLVHVTAFFLNSFVRIFMGAEWFNSAIWPAALIVIIATLLQASIATLLRLGSSSIRNYASRFILIR
jgi:hypothetical protein